MPTTKTGISGDARPPESNSARCVTEGPPLRLPPAFLPEGSLLRQASLPRYLATIRAPNREWDYAGRRNTRRWLGAFAASKKRDILPGQVFHKQWPLKNVAGFDIALEETGHEMQSRNQDFGAGGRWLRVQCVCRRSIHDQHHRSNGRTTQGKSAGSHCQWSSKRLVNSW